MPRPCPRSRTPDAGLLIRVKICGLNNAEGLDAAVEACADWVGYNFFERSPRFVTPAQAAAFSDHVLGGPKRVGLFVNPTDAAIADTLDIFKLDVLQIYAPAGRAMEIRGTFNLPVWRSVHVTTVADLPTDTDEDSFVIEPRPPAGATRPGGNAVNMDWSVLAGWSVPRPWLLAGGLRPGNVVEAIRASGAEAVDVSSGVESAPGVKSPELIREFIRLARLPGAGESGAAPPT